jgi:hypothetical protein
VTPPLLLPEGEPLLLPPEPPPLLLLLLVEMVSGPVPVGEPLLLPLLPLDAEGSVAAPDEPPELDEEVLLPGQPGLPLELLHAAGRTTRIQPHRGIEAVMPEPVATAMPVASLAGNVVCARFERGWQGWRLGSSRS